MTIQSRSIHSNHLQGAAPQRYSGLRACVTSLVALAAAATAQGQSLNGSYGLATLNSAANGDRSIVKVYEDSAPFPSTLRACASQHFWTDRDHWLSAAAAFVPLAAANTFLASPVVTAGSPNLAVGVFGAGNASSPAATWQPLSLNNEQAAAADGFVVAHVDWNNNNGARGFIVGQQRNSNEPIATDVAGSSQHRYVESDMHVECNSFSMPVRKGVNFKVSFTATSGTPVARAFFVPLATGITLSGSQVVAANTLYQNNTAGFLVAYLNAATDGDRGTIELQRGTPQSLTTYASTSVHFYSGSDTWVPMNSATIPVNRGESFIAKFTPTSGFPVARVVWFPAVDAAAAGAAAPSLKVVSPQ